MPDDDKTLDDMPATGADDKGDTPDLAAEVEKWKAHSRKQEERAKANAAAVAERDALKQRLDEIENAGKSELERAIAKAEAAEKKAADAEVARKQAELASIKARIGAKYELSPTLAELLRGDDEESIAAHAEAIKAELPKSSQSLDIGQGKSGPDVDPLIAAIDKGFSHT